MIDLLPVSQIDGIPDMPWKEKLAYLTFMFHKSPQVNCPLSHVFEDGRYIRRIEIPKGTLFIGRPHRVGHIVELGQGSVIHVTEKCRRIVHAPFTMTTSPEYQVCALALTDIQAQTVHPDDGSRDIEALEQRFFEPVESLTELGEQVDMRLRKRIYERNSSSGSGSGSNRGNWNIYCGI